MNPTSPDGAEAVGAAWARPQTWARRPRLLALPPLPALLVPLRRATFRWLWLGMSTSYAGDRLQQLAQAWLVATLTNSALGVGMITAFSSLSLLLMPLGGVVAEQVNRRRMLLVGQLLGAASTAVVAALVLTDLIAVWHIYAWALVNGVVHLVSRPAYKVVLTRSVPSGEARQAVALNSMTETAAMAGVNAAGSLLLALLGLPVAFVLNTASYLVAAGSLWRLRGLDPPPAGRPAFAAGRVLPDLTDGVRYLRRRPALLYPLALTFASVALTGPAVGLLAAVVHARGGAVTDLGLLVAAAGLGSFAGAGWAGTRADGASPVRDYAALALAGAGALALFTVSPTGVTASASLFVIGFVLFAQAVWNKTRVSQLAGEAYQARLQSITSMAFTLGFPAGMLWAGVAVDRLGVDALYAGAALLAAISLATFFLTRGAGGAGGGSGAP